MQQPKEPHSEDIPVIIANANAGAVRDTYAALNANNLPELARLLHPEASWYTPGRSPVAGEAAGRDAVSGQFARYAASTGGTFRASLKKLLQSEDGRVIAIHRDTGERSGKRLDVGCCTVFDLEDGLIIEGREHFHDLYSWDEFWS